MKQTKTTLLIEVEFPCADEINIKLWGGADNNDGYEGIGNGGNIFIGWASEHLLFVNVFLFYQTWKEKSFILLAHYFNLASSPISVKEDTKGNEDTPCSNVAWANLKTKSPVIWQHQ